MKVKVGRLRMKLVELGVEEGRRGGEKRGRELRRLGCSLNFLFFCVDGRHPIQRLLRTIRLAAFFSSQIISLFPFFPFPFPVLTAWIPRQSRSGSVDKPNADICCIRGVE